MYDVKLNCNFLSSNIYKEIGLRQRLSDNTLPNAFNVTNLMKVRVVIYNRRAFIRLANDFEKISCSKAS